MSRCSHLQQSEALAYISDFIVQCKPVLCPANCPQCQDGVAHEPPLPALIEVLNTLRLAEEAERVCDDELANYRAEALEYLLRSDEGQLLGDVHWVLVWDEVNNTPMPQVSGQSRQEYRDICNFVDDIETAFFAQFREEIANVIRKLDTPAILIQHIKQLCLNYGHLDRRVFDETVQRLNALVQLRNLIIEHARIEKVADKLVEHYVYQNVFVLSEVGEVLEDWENKQWVLQNRKELGGRDAAAVESMIDEYLDWYRGARAELLQRLDQEDFDPSLRQTCILTSTYYSTGVYLIKETSTHSFVRTYILTSTYYSTRK